MAVFRVQKTRDYTVMSNYHLKDKALSLKAKGLLSVMLSLPEDWDYSIEGLVAISKEGITAIKATLKELKECGYLQIIKERTSKGTYEYIYDIFEKPQIEKPGVENPPMDNPPVDNQLQLITKESNTKELNTKDIRGKFIPPSIEQIRAYCASRKNNVDADRFFDFYEAKGWMIGKNKMKDWKAAVRTWENASKPKSNSGFNQCMQNSYSHEQMDELEKLLIDN